MPNEIEIIGRVSNASVLKGTGKGWREWLRILERAGAAQWTHKETAAHLRTKYKLTWWWQHGVTHGFEIHTGRRIDGRTLKGDYGTTATKTVPLAAAAAWKWLWTPRALDVWMKPLSPFTLKKGRTFETEDGVFGEVRTIKAGARARLRWRTHWKDAVSALSWPAGTPPVRKRP